MVGEELVFLQESGDKDLPIEVVSVGSSFAEISQARTSPFEIVLIYPANGLQESTVAAINAATSGNFGRQPFVVLVGEPPEPILRSVAQSLGVNEWMREPEVR